jgi:probable rRNA maturation factor
MSIAIVFSEEVKPWNGYKKSAFSALYKKASEEYKSQLPETLEVVFVDNEVMKKLNQTYRGLNKTTDVLSFKLSEDLGQIVISIPRAVEQSHEYGNSESREILFLFLHGLLHLAGFDDNTDEKREKMIQIANEYLNCLEAK